MISIFSVKQKMWVSPEWRLGWRGCQDKLEQQLWGMRTGTLSA